VELSESERSQLAMVLEVEPDEVDKALSRYGAAATEEYVRMMLGQRVFTRGQDVREYRLLLMIKHVFAPTLPSEQQVSRLFQTTAGQSRGLLRAVMSKYQYELREVIHATLAGVLDRASYRDDDEVWEFTADAETVAALNRELVAVDGTLPEVTHVVGTVGMYEIHPSAYQALRDRLGDS
jgi:hypothetical protein